MVAPFLDVEASFCVAGARNSALCRGVSGVSKNEGRRGTFQQDLQDAYCVAGAVQETCS